MSQALTKPQLKELSHLLTKRRNELTAQMEDSLANLTPAENTAGSLSQDEAVRLKNQTREVDQALTDLDRAELLRIDHAFEKIQAGTYGQCEECGRPISFERLRIEPMTQHCVACKSQWEKQQAKTADS